jgi:hypothetical protein
MKWAITIALAACLGCAAGDLTTLDHVTYQDVRVTRVDADGIIALYSGGGGKIFFTNLPPEIQQKYGYDPVKAAALAAKQERMRRLGRMGVGYRLSELARAQAEARSEGKPLAFLATKLSVLAENVSITGTGSGAASIQDYEAFKNATVLVFTDSYDENHKQPSIVDGALHSPDDDHYTPPKVVITDADLTKLIAVVQYSTDYPTRQQRIAAALASIKAQRK